MTVGDIVAKFRLDLGDFQASIQQATGGLNQVEGGSRKTGTAVDGLGGSLQGLALKVAGALGLYKLADVMSSTIKESTLLAARVETLGVVMGTVGKNVGLSAGQMENYSLNVKDMGITTQVARETVIRMVQAQMDLTQAIRLARIAQDAAVIGNVNSSEALERMIYGIQTGQIEVLKTIGLNVNFENSYKKLALQLNKNSEDLTEIEKSQARMNVVLEAGERITGTYEAAMGTVGKQLNTLPRYIEEVKLKFGALFTPALSVIVQELTQNFKDLGAGLASIQGQEEIKAWADRFELAARVIIGAGSIVKTLVMGIYDSFRLTAAGAMYVNAALWKLYEGFHLGLAFINKWVLGNEEAAAALTKDAEVYGKTAADMVEATFDLVSKAMGLTEESSKQAIILKKKELETAKAVYNQEVTITAAQKQLKEKLVADISGLMDQETGKFLAEYDRRMRIAGTNAELIKQVNEWATIEAEKNLKKQTEAELRADADIAKIKGDAFLASQLRYQADLLEAEQTGKNTVKITEKYTAEQEAIAIKATTDTIAAQGKAYDDYMAALNAAAKSAAEEQIAVNKKITKHEWDELEARGNAEELFYAESTDRSREREEKERKASIERITLEAQVYESLKDYGAKYAEAHKALLDERIKKMRALGVDEAVILAYTAEEQYKIDQKRLLSSKSFFDGVKAGLLEMQHNEKTTAEYGDEVFKGVFGKGGASEITLKTFFDDIFKGELKSGMDYLEAFGKSVLAVWSKMLAEMTAQWVASGLGKLLFGGGDDDKTGWLGKITGLFKGNGNWESPTGTDAYGEVLEGGGGGGGFDWSKVGGLVGTGYKIYGAIKAALATPAAATPAAATPAAATPVAAGGGTAGMGTTTALGAMAGLYAWATFLGAGGGGPVGEMLGMRATLAQNLLPEPGEAWLALGKPGLWPEGWEYDLPDIYWHDYGVDREGFITRLKEKAKEYIWRDPDESEINSGMLASYGTPIWEYIWRARYPYVDEGTRARLDAERAANASQIFQPLPAGVTAPVGTEAYWREVGYLRAMSPGIAVGDTVDMGAIPYVDQWGASGLTITEPTFGVGLRTGRRIMIGEAGPEEVTPVDGSSGSGISLTINIGGHLVADRSTFDRFLVDIQEGLSRLARTRY